MHCLPDKQAENYFNSPPREGCDSAFANCNRHTAATTHALLRRATAQCKLFHDKTQSYNSRSPAESDLDYQIDEARL